MIGPVFFILVQTSIERGVMHGLSVAFGESMSDIIFLAIYYVGFTHMSIGDSFSRWIGFGGVLVLAVTGMLMIRKARKKWKYPQPEPLNTSKWSLFLKGFLINSLNPFVYVFWAGVMGVLKSKYAEHPEHILMFCVGIFVFKLFADVFKVVLSGKIKHFISNSMLRYVSVSTGVILIIYALVLSYRLYFAN